MANGHGGARRGAGRKPKAEKFARPIARAEKRLADALPGLVDKLLALAEGVLVEDDREDAPEPFYRKPPDLRALTYCFDRIMGRPDVEPAPLPAPPDLGDDYVLDLGTGPQDGTEDAGADDGPA